MIPSHISHVLATRDKFIEISKQSDERFTAMIGAAKDFRIGMEPLKKEVDQLQTRVKNLMYCIEGLSHVQNYYKTGLEVEKTIIQGPSASLTNYLEAMDRTKDSLVYFNQNNTEHLEFTRLNTLFSNGLKSLHKYFDEILSHAFAPVPPDVLYRLVEKKDSVSLDNSKADETSTILECDAISDESIHTMKEISAWLRKATSVVVASTEGGQKSHPHLARIFRMGNGDSASIGGYQLPQPLRQYCEFREDLMHVTLLKLHEYQKLLEKNAQSAHGRSGTSGSQLNLGAPGRRRGFKATGIVWDANSRRGMTSGLKDTDDLDSEHYTTSLSAFLILIEHERLLLDRLQLTVNSHELHLAYSLICRRSLTDIMAEGGSYVRLMSKATSCGEFYMIVSLLTILRHFTKLSPFFVENLKVDSTLSQPITDLVDRFRAQIKATLDAFLQQLQPGAGSSQVPPDATVHEQTSNVLLFLEKLIDYQITVGLALTWDQARVQPEAMFAYLATINSNPKMTQSAFGQFIFRVITSLVVSNDKKSEAYSDDLSRIVFQMNNLRYILLNLKQTDLQKIIDKYDNSAVDKFSRILDEGKQIYAKACMRFIGLPPSAFMDQFSHQRQMDSKERSQMKDLWNGVNQGFASLLKQHSQLSIPDVEFREDLRVCLSQNLMTLYQTFYNRSLQTPFTSRREKYIKLSPSEFQKRLDQMFFPAAAQVTPARS